MTSGESFGRAIAVLRVEVTVLLIRARLNLGRTCRTPPGSRIKWPPMAASLETVVKQLEDSGIVAPGKLENFIPPKANPKSVEELVRELVKQNHLTKFQAQQVALGKSKALILGGYTLLDKIGAGGMGQVFKALHRRMERTVAIKMLPATMLKDAVAAARFQREVVAAAKLNHSNIVTAYDADQANGVHFLVMEYVEGTDLSILVKKHGALEGSKALNYILQAAKGLEFAHKKGVVHRDIKPANLLVDSEGTVKILDMGLARIESQGDAATQAELTGTGAVMGTVDYMAPEQAISTKGVDARADIYSLGCTLYYLLAGKATYDGETLMAKLIAHREAEIPSLSDVQEGVPDDVQAIFARMVAKKVEARYQNMTDVIADLERAIAGQAAPTSLAPPAESTDTGLTRFFKELPSPTTHKSKPTATKPTAAAADPSFNRDPEGSAPAPSATPPAKRKPNPKLFLYGSIAGGVLSLIGIPLVLFFALSAGDKPPKKVKPTGAEVVPASSPIPPANYALEFDGKTSYVVTPLRFQPDRPITVEAIVVPRTDGGTLQYVIGDAENREGFALAAFNQAWTMQLLWNTVSATSRAPVAAQQAVHLAGVYDGKEIRLYVDGALQQSLPGVSSGISGVPILIGAHPCRPGRPTFPFCNHINNYFDGTIDEVRISKTARYTTDFTPQPRCDADADALALYHFDEGSGSVLKDSSRNNHHGQIVGAKWVRVQGAENQPRIVLRKKLSGHAHTAWDVAFSPDAKWLASSGGNGSGELFLWDPATGVKVGEFKGHTRNPGSLAFSPDSQRLLSVGNSEALKEWDVPKRSLLSSTDGSFGQVAFSRDGKLLATGGGANERALRDPTTLAVKASLAAYAGITRLEFSHDGKWLAASAGGRLDIHQLPEGKRIRSDMWNALLSVAFSDDNRLLAVAGDNFAFVQIYDVTNPELPLPPLGKLDTGESVKTLVWLPGNRYLICATASQSELQLWDTQTSQRIARVPGHTKPINTVALSRDGRTLATASEDHDVILWDVATSGAGARKTPRVHLGRRRAWHSRPTKS